MNIAWLITKLEQSDALTDLERESLKHLREYVKLMGYHVVVERETIILRKELLALKRGRNE